MVYFIPSRQFAQEAGYRRLAYCIPPSRPTIAARCPRLKATRAFIRFFLWDPLNTRITDPLQLHDSSHVAPRPSHMVPRQPFFLSLLSALGRLSQRPKIQTPSYMYEPSPVIHDAHVECPMVFVRLAICHGRYGPQNGRGCNRDTTYFADMLISYMQSN